MSDHLDGLSAREDPRLDISDVYLFRGQFGTVFVINTNPLSGPGGFHPEALYEFNIDTDGDGIENIALRATFLPPDPTGDQPLVLRQVTGSNATNRYAPGHIVAYGRTNENITGSTGIKLFAGSAGEPFYIEKNVVTAVRTAVINGSKLDLSAYDPSKATNLFGKTNVSAIVLEVPNTLFGSATTIGFWGSVTLPTDAPGGWRQIDRAGNPLVSTLYGFNEGDAYNAAPTKDDLASYGEKIASMTARAVAVNGTAEDPDKYGASVRDILVPDMLHYRIGSAAFFGVDRRNGRGLTENTPEAMFHIVLNRNVDMGLDAGSATGTLRPRFPYLSKPVPPPYG
ncbi:DUF4331 family protein [Streptomyces sp. NPDC004647]|uniref:DUF4331 family protein n=1 Tax=Streptomyces sp. NPDC004647 TaxID=3154671 RepID=UPI0033BC6147